MRRGGVRAPFCDSCLLLAMEEEVSLILVLISLLSLCGPIRLAEDGERKAGTGPTVGQLCFAYVSRHYLRPGILTRSRSFQDFNDSDKMMPGIPLVQLSLLRSTHISTHLF